MADAPEPISQESPIEVPAGADAGRAAQPADAPASTATSADPALQPMPSEQFDSAQLLANAGQPLGAIELLDDVDLDVRVELGRTEMYIEDVLRLGVGCVVELDKLAGDPVDVYVNQRLVARGEVLVLGDNFCVRISDVLSVAGPKEGLP